MMCLKLGGVKLLEKFFKLGHNNTNVKTEILAGATTFLAMAYIIFVNPSILSSTGMDSGAILVATCISAAIGSILMGLISNYPFALAPGMGLNVYFAATICGTMGYSWQAGLAAVFLSGIIFIIITLTGLRENIVKAVPKVLKSAIGVGIGLFLAYVGVKNAGLISFTVDPWNISKTMEDGTLVTNSMISPAFDFASPMAILSIIGLIITAILVVKKVKAGLLIGIVATSIIGIVMQLGFGINVGITVPGGFNIASLTPTFGQFIGGFSELLNTGQGIGVTIFSIVSVLISLTLVDLFDSMGSFIGASSKAGLTDSDGNLPDAKKALLADGIATSVGAVLGTSTVTTYVESSAGIATGGRTGLTSVVTGVLFFAAVLLSPILGLIPASAIAPILIIVGVLMVGHIGDINWHNLEDAVPAFLLIIAMPFGFSIADGIATGFLFYIVIKLCLRKFEEINSVLVIMTILFIIRYFIIMI